MRKTYNLFIYLLSGCLFLLLFIPSAHTQSLSFSRVLLLSSVEDTVPVGKAWKVESIVTSSGYQYQGNQSCVDDINMRQVFINGASRFLQAEAVTTGANSIIYSGNAFPLWLPAGTRLHTNCSSSTLSIIEFNIVP